MGPQRQPVLPGQIEGQLENVGSAAVGQAMPIQVGWSELRGQHPFDLRPELQLHLVQPGAGEQLRNSIVAIEVARFIDQ